MDQCLSTPAIGDKPHQPCEFKFPKRDFGYKNKVKRSFQSSWFKRWSWLHYIEQDDKVYCYVCVRAYNEGKLTGGNVDASFMVLQL